MNGQRTLTVVYKCIDGAHIFSSTDGLACGLYAASTDLREAFNDVPVQAKLLLKLNHGIESEVVSEISFDEFLEQLVSAITRALESRHKNAGPAARVVGVLPPNKAIALRMGMATAKDRIRERLKAGTEAGSCATVRPNADQAK